MGSNKISTIDLEEPVVEALNTIDTVAEKITTVDSNVDSIKTTVEGNSTKLDEIKKSVSDGKTLVADAITDKGITTATDASFSTIATNIDSIVTLDSVPSLAAKSYTPTTSNIVIGKGNYLSGDQTIVGDANLVAGNIAKGKSIFGVAGSYDPMTSSGISYYDIDGTEQGYDYGTTISVGKTLPGKLCCYMLIFTTNDELTLGVVWIPKLGYMFYETDWVWTPHTSTTLTAKSGSSTYVTITMSSDLKTINSVKYIGYGLQNYLNRYFYLT